MEGVKRNRNLTLEICLHFLLLYAVRDRALDLVSAFMYNHSLVLKRVFYIVGFGKTRQDQPMVDSGIFPVDTSPDLSVK